MIIIGERINSTRKSIRGYLEKKDFDLLIKEAQVQVQAGAKFIDLNCAAMMEREADYLKALMPQIQEKTGSSVCIDSPSPSVIRDLLPLHKGRPFVNSITAEDEKAAMLLPAVKKYNAYAVALTIDKKGMPHDTEERVSIAYAILDQAKKSGVDAGSIYIDPLVKPVSTEPKQASYYLDAVKRLSEKGVNTTGGLSNVSFGLPKRAVLNAVFLSLAINAGIKAAIIDPTDILIKDVLSGKCLPDDIFNLAKDVLLGSDDYAMKYIRAFRSGAFDNI